MQEHNLCVKYDPDEGDWAVCIDDVEVRFDSITDLPSALDEAMALTGLQMSDVIGSGIVSNQGDDVALIERIVADLTRHSLMNKTH